MEEKFYTYLLPQFINFFHESFFSSKISSIFIVVFFVYPRNFLSKSSFMPTVNYRHRSLSTFLLLLLLLLISTINLSSFSHPLTQFFSLLSHCLKDGEKWKEAKERKKENWWSENVGQVSHQLRKSADSILLQFQPDVFCNEKNYQVQKLLEQNSIYKQPLQSLIHKQSLSNQVILKS